MINNYHIKERFSHHHFINESSASVWVSLLCELQKITIFSPNCPDDRTIDLHSLRMIMELLSTINIITHNGLNGLFVPPWQRRLVKHAMLPCKQAQLVRRIHGSIRPRASLQENVPTAHPVLTQVLNTGRCLVLCHTSTSSPSLRLTKKVSSPPKQKCNVLLWLVALYIRCKDICILSCVVALIQKSWAGSNSQSRQEAWEVNTANPLHLSM